MKYIKIFSEDGHPMAIQAQVNGWIAEHGDAITVDNIEMSACVDERGFYITIMVVYHD